MPYRERYNRRIPLTEDEVAAHALGIQIPRKYRPSLKTEAFVRHIRRIATELFAEAGLNGVSLADVSRATQLGPTHLQYYFGRAA